MFTNRQKVIIFDLLSGVQVKPGQSQLLREIEEILDLLKASSKTDEKTTQDPEVADSSVVPPSA